MDHLVLCDGPDMQTATCESVPATGVYVVGVPMEWSDVQDLMVAIAVLFVVAWGARAVVRMLWPRA